jgi:ribosomal subunit interface protein
MKLPLQITFRDLDPTPAIRQAVAERADRLDTICDRLISCRVAIEAPNRRTHHGPAQYYVRIDVKAPGIELVATHSPTAITQADLYVVIDRAFDEMDRQVDEWNAKSRWMVKRHSETPRGRVAKIFWDRDFGFIEAKDGREIYFHKNSVLRHHWDHLEVGTEVRFAEEDGDKGPQASTVDVVGRPRRAVSRIEGNVDRPSFIG